MADIETLQTFRVHYLDGSSLDLLAENAADARAKAEPLAKRQETKITKVKLLRGEG